MGEQSVFFACHQHLLSMPIRRVERLLVADEVKVCATGAAAGGVPVVQAGARKFAAWNLARMVELPATRTSWILLRVTYEGAELPLALGVGQCLKVGALPDTTPLPPGVFRERQSALWATFAATGLGTAARMGYCLDPLRLWSRAELEQSASALLSAREPLTR